MKNTDLIDAICRIIEPDLFGRQNTALNIPHEMAYKTVREKTKQETREKAEKIAALLRSG